MGWEWRGSGQHAQFGKFAASASAGGTLHYPAIETRSGPGPLEGLAQHCGCHGGKLGPFGLLLRGGTSPNPVPIDVECDTVIGYRTEEAITFPVPGFRLQWARGEAGRKPPHYTRSCQRRLFVPDHTRTLATGNTLTTPADPGCLPPLRSPPRNNPISLHPDPAGHHRRRKREPLLAPGWRRDRR